MNKTIRIGQVNILNSEDGLATRYELLAEHLKAENILVAGVEEILDPHLLESHLRQAGYGYYAFTGPSPDFAKHDHIGIVSKIPLLNYSTIDLGQNERPSIHAEFLYEDRKIHVFAAHFAWGSQAEGTRLRQASILSTVAGRIQEEEPHSIVVLAGDLNADDTSRTTRYLQGLDLDAEGKSTYWTDAYSVAGKPDQWATSDQGRGTWGPATASARGVHRMDLMPARRIDYLMTYGWQYGKDGCPTAFGRFGEPLTLDGVELSDHYGIWADFLV